MALMFLLILINTAFTPLMMDDYMYSFVYGTGTAARVDSFADIIQSMQVHYFAWGGRVTVHAVVQLLLWWDKIVYNVLNAAVYVLLSYVIYRFAGAEKHDFKCYIAILIAMWFWIPMYGETVFWLSGSINYLWNVTFNLFWLFQFKKQLDAPHAPRASSKFGFASPASLSAASARTSRSLAYWSRCCSWCK